MFDLFYLGTTCSGLCFVLYNCAQSRIGATTGSLFLNVGSIINTVPGIMIYSTYPTLTNGLGVILTVIGVSIATIDFKKSDEELELSTAS
ncbi:MAG: EamA family transporter [Endozoicomonas sp.]